MAGKTKPELQSEVEAAYIDFLDRSTKAQLQSLIEFLDDSPHADTRMEPATPPAQIVIIDQGGYRTTLDLNDRTIHHAAASGITYNDAVEVKGHGPILTIDLTTTFLSPMNALDFAAHPTDYPIAVTFSYPEPENVPEPLAEAEPEPEPIPADEADMLSIDPLRSGSPDAANRTTRSRASGEPETAEGRFSAKGQSIGAASPLQGKLEDDA